MHEVCLILYALVLQHFDGALYHDVYNVVVINFVLCVLKVFGFYEELLSSRFPHSNYKMVYVDESYQDSSNYSTLTILK